MTDKLREDWSYLTVVILDSIEMSTERISRIWNMIVDHFETKPLPWEVVPRQTVLVELFTGLGHEYLVIDGLMKSGVRQIINTLQGYLGRRK